MLTEEGLRSRPLTTITATVVEWAEDKRDPSCRETTGTEAYPPLLRGGVLSLQRAFVGRERRQRRRLQRQRGVRDGMCWRREDGAGGRIPSEAAGGAADEPPLGVSTHLMEETVPSLPNLMLIASYRPARPTEGRTNQLRESIRDACNAQEYGANRGSLVGININPLPLDAMVKFVANCLKRGNNGDSGGGGNVSTLATAVHKKTMGIPLLVWRSLEEMVCVIFVARGDPKQAGTPYL